MKRFKISILTVAVAVSGVFGWNFVTNASLGIAAVPGQWETTGSLLSPRAGHHVILLNDGRVLVTGGLNSQGDPIAQTELYDYATGTFSPGGTMITARSQHRDALLLTGQVLVIGGRDGSGNALNSAELFDPVSGAFSPTGNMQRFRRLHRSTTLADGRVLVAGGVGGPSNTDNNILFSGEIYDPATGTFAFTTSNMVNRRRGHMQILLDNGKVLLVGGFGGPPNSNPSTLLKTAELYDPNTNTFSPTGNMVVARQGPFIAKLPDGKVLVLGGHDQAENPIASAEIYDPATGTFSATGNPTTGRFGGRIAPLLDGRVLYIGGQTSTSETDVTNTTELFDPQTGTFSLSGNLVTGRRDGYPTLLPNGQVLYVGGVDAAGTTLGSAELYTADSETQNAISVRQQYLDFLDREPDAEGFTAWVSALDGGLPPSTMIEIFMDSGEFFFKGKFIARAYLGLLTRDADHAGFRAWLELLLAGISREQIVESFLNSGEFQSNFGSNLTNAQFVQTMYANVLQRSADTAGLNFWAGQLNGGQMTRAQVALTFLDSIEFQNLSATQNRVDVALLYFDMLRRDPDPTGFSGWVGVLNAGTPLTAVIDGFLNSAEYNSRF
jgi:N-acetylneuraminic acid mutarotase